LNYVQPAEQKTLENKKFLNGNVKVAKISCLAGERHSAYHRYCSLLSLQYSDTCL